MTILSRRAEHDKAEKLISPKTPIFRPFCDLGLPYRSLWRSYYERSNFQKDEFKISKGWKVYKVEKLERINLRSHLVGSGPPYFSILLRRAENHKAEFKKFENSCPKIWPKMGYLSGREDTFALYFWKIEEDLNYSVFYFFNIRFSALRTDFTTKGRKS